MIIVDVETTGLDETKHQLIDIGAVDFYNPSNQFYGTCKLDEGAEINDFALSINGQTHESINDPSRQDLASLMESYFNWVDTVERKTLLAQNTDFDFRFLKAAADKYQLAWPHGRRKLDMHSTICDHMVARGLNPEDGIDKYVGLSTQSGDKIMDYVGIPQEPRPHVGLNGAIWEAEAYSRMVKGEGLFEQFKKYALPDYL